jgi:transcription initiation factor TFIID subunit 2
LVIFLPDKLRIKDIRPPGTLEPVCEPFELEIEYELDDFRDALHFAGVEDGDARYPHVYTRNSPFPGMASALFPCVDDGSTRCNFDVSIRYPRTVGDALSKSPVVDDNKADSVMSGTDEDQNDLTEEEKALEMSVICSGLLTDEVCLVHQSLPELTNDTRLSTRQTRLI